MPSWRRRRIARGRVASLNVEAAKAHPGVVAVMTPQNRPPIAIDPDLRDSPFNFKFEALKNDRVRYAGQPIAVVIARTLEAATEGAALLAPTYEAEAPATHLDASESYAPPNRRPRRSRGSPEKGDVEAGLARRR